MSLIRADRFATLFIVQPLRGCMPRRKKLRIPILMYHSISDDSGQNIHPYFLTQTAPRVFESHMRFLSENGYRSLSTGEVVGLLEAPRSPGPKAVVITFDDGYRDFYTNAFPVLAKYGLGATVYLPTAYIDNSRQKFKGKECMTWAEVHELSRAGIHFGSHTVSHPQLRYASLPDLEYELKASKDAIEANLGEAVRSFAYPYAFPEGHREFTHLLRDVLLESGYQNGVSTAIGSSHMPGDEFFLKRLPANSCDDLSLFRAKLEGSYDWLHAAQYVTKRVQWNRRMPSVEAARQYLGRI